MSLSPGTRFGSYEVAAMIGVGGMGEVYRATDVRLKRSVALKVLSTEFLKDANRVARLQREAEMLASLNHVNVAHIYGLERSGDTTALVMELIDGPTLAERIAHGKLPPAEALVIAQQIAAALEAAHEQGIVHRDLKPANIKLKTDGTVKVLDFGIAKPVEQRAASGPHAALTTPAMTEAGLVLGTAAYMAPEQARGKPIDKRADIWSFGCVLYEMLTGKGAFAGDDLTSTLARVLEREPDWKALPAGLAPSVRTTLELCLAKEPRQRVADIRDVRLALEGRLLAPASSAVQPPLWRRALPVAVALVLGGVLVGIYERTQRAAPPTVAMPLAQVTRFSLTPPAPAALASGGGTDLALSPDGKRLVYLAQGEASAPLSLSVRELDALAGKPLPGSENSAGNANPFFSPDGRYVAVKTTNRGIVRLSLDGAPPAKLADDPGPYAGGAWATDGTVIIASSSRLLRVDGNRSEVVAEGTTGQFFGGPVFLPGARAVLFVIVEGGSDHVAVLDLDTGEHKLLVEGGSPAYAPSGHLLFVRGTTLTAVPFDAAELAVTGAPVALQSVRHPSLGTAADYTVSATGTLAYVPDDGALVGDREVVWVDRSGRAELALREPVTLGRDPRLSPDGTRLALTTGQFGDGDVWIYDLRGRPPIPLAIPGDNRFPVWSPDGARVAFARVSGNVNLARLFIVPADGRVLNPQELRSEQVGLPLDWSPGDELLVLQLGPDLRPDLAVTPAAPEGEVRLVGATDEAEADGALSPDGRRVAYVSSRTGEPEVWVSRYPDGVGVRVSTNGGFEPRWSRDGRELFFLGRTGGIQAVSFDASGELSFDAPVELFPGGPYFVVAANSVFTYDVAPDGRFLMLRVTVAGEQPSSIVVVENWTEELKARSSPAQ